MTDKAISPLRRRMIEDMTVRGFTASTQRGYLRAVRDFTAFLGRSPDRASAADLRRYQLRMRSGGASATSMNAAVSALRFFFTVTLGRRQAATWMTTVREPHKLPVVLSPEEVGRLLEAAPGLKYRAALSVAYGAGLRASEVVSLEVSDIDSARMVLRVEQRTVELRAAQAELVRNERLATMGQLTAIVSHELRNPLGAMRFSIAAIKQLAPQDVPLLQDSVAIVDRSITRCDNIIGDLLDYTKVRPLEREAVAIDGWLAGMLDEYWLPEGITLHRELASGAEADFDRERLRRALINVVDNACQALTAKDGGAPAPIEKLAPQLTVSTHISDSRAELRIADNGPGIDQETLQKIFEPLYSTKAFGVGLGLTVVKQIMEQHKGGVEFESAPGRGTEVVLWLPRPEPAWQSAS